LGGAGNARVGHEEVPYGKVPGVNGQPEGRRELYATLCGHAVHFDCFMAHAESLRERAERGVHYEGRSAIDMDR
jgi:hypothetical protein